MVAAPSTHAAAGILRAGWLVSNGVFLGWWRPAGPPSRTGLLPLGHAGGSEARQIARALAGMGLSGWPQLQPGGSLARRMNAY